MQVWKVRCDPQAGWVGVELRDSERQEVGFYAFPLGKGKSRNISRETLIQGAEKWWMGLEEVIGERLILHGYESQDMPIHQGIQCFDPKGKLEWERPDRSYVGGVTGGILAAAEAHQQGKMEVLDLNTGETLATYSDRAAAARATDLQAVQTAREEAMTFPRLVPGTSPEMEKWQTWIAKHYPNRQLIQMEELVRPTFQVNVLGLKTQEGKVDQWMEVRQGKKLVEKTALALDADGLGLDTFFLIGDTLLYMKDGVELGIMGGFSKT